MFELTIKERMISKIKKSCEKYLPYYKERMISLLQQYDPDEISYEDFNRIKMQGKIEYCDLVAEEIVMTYIDKRKMNYEQFKQTIITTDFKDETLNEIARSVVDEGMLAGVVYLFCYSGYAQKDPDIHDCIDLINYQEALLQSAFDEVINILDDMLEKKETNNSVFMNPEELEPELLEDDSVIDIEPTPEPQKEEPQQTEPIQTAQPTQTIQTEQPRKQSEVITLILGVALAISLVFNINQYTQINDLKTKHTSYESSYSELEQKYNALAAEQSSSKELQKKYNALAAKYNDLETKYNEVNDLYTALYPMGDFYFQNSVIVPSGSKTYHTYFCETKPYSDRFNIFNTVYAKGLGYTPCSKCNPPK